ncbi:hypothetical protein Tco_1508400 [Tanacetum coccineum]
MSGTHLVAGDKFPQRHVAGERPDMSPGKRAIVDPVLSFSDYSPATNVAGENIVTCSPISCSVWGALLKASKLYNNVEMAELASKKMVELEPKNDGAYVDRSCQMFMLILMSGIVLMV